MSETTITITSEQAAIARDAAKHLRAMGATAVSIEGVPLSSNSLAPYKARAVNVLREIREAQEGRKDLTVEMKAKHLNDAERQAVWRAAAKSLDPKKAEREERIRQYELSLS